MERVYLLVALVIGVALSFVSFSDATTYYDYTGTIVMNIDITVKSAIPAGTRVTCDGTAKVGSFDDEAETYADIGNGRASCTLIIPYSWLLTYPGNVAAQINYSLETSDNESNGTNNRYSVGGPVYVNIPTSNTTITKDMSAVL